MTGTDAFSSLFASESDSPGEEAAADSWKVLIVDDDRDIHSALRLSLADVLVEGRKLQLFDAESAKQAKAVLDIEADMALILLDVVMETELAGLELVHHIRNERGNRSVRIILVTGQPGYAPQRTVVTDYEIDGYRLKSELTSDRIFASVCSALRTYRVLNELERQRIQLRRQNEALSRWGYVFEHAGWGTYIESIDGQRIELCNPAFARLHGYTVDEILALPPSQLIAPELRQAWRECLQRNDSADYFSCESIHRGRNGAEFPVQADISLIKDSGGQMLYRVVNTQDITQRKQAELIAKRYEAIVQSSEDAIIGKSLEGIVTSWNPGAEKIFGYACEEMLGQPMLRLFPDELKDEEESILNRLKQGETVSHFETVRIRKDGVRIDVSVTISPIHDQAGHIIGASKVARDITELKKTEQSLKANMEFLRLSQQAGEIGSWETDLSTKQQTWSETVRTCLGFPEFEHPTWDDYISTVHPEDRHLVLEAIKLHFEQREKYQVEYRIIDRQKKVRWMFSMGNAERDESGNPTIFRGIVQDLTVRKLAEEKLRLSERIFQSTQEGIMITDTECRIIDVNDSFRRITGYAREDVIGKNPRILQSGQHDSTFYTGMWKQIADNGHFSGEIWNRRKDGGIFAEFITISALLDDHGKLTNYVGILSDITAQKQHEIQLEHIAHYDTLTGIPNRALLIDRMRQSMAQTRREQKLLAVCYLDLDGFKPINDAFGHSAGDQVLVEIAQRINNSLRASDTVARLGGDEFVILLIGMDNIHECCTSLDRLLSIISNKFVIQHQEFNVTASIGVTLFPTDDADSDALLRHADQAMYQAKQLGKNRYCIHDLNQEMQLKNHYDRLLRIKQGFQNNEFELFYQPKIELSSYKVVGVEALIRWRHPEHGLLSPDRFLSVIENSPFENPCGEWVINTALQQLGYWIKAGLTLQVSINISANHLQSSLFVATLREILARHPDVPAERLQIEILETAALVDIPKASRVIEECAGFGVSFALDDFGTGYSSLSYLRRLPAKTLKIDLSFVRDMLVDKDDRAIVKGVISLGRTFNRITVAEGVETQEHLELLRDLGCDMGQGFGIARPMPAGEVIAWCKAYSGKASKTLNSLSAINHKEIRWESKFEIGHERIDFEHRIFLNLIIEVSKEAHGRCNHRRIKRLLSEVAEYAKFHFVSEENIMEEINYPELESHKVLHRHLLTNLSDIAYDFNRQQVDYCGLVNFLFEWFTKHTTLEDRKIALFIADM